MEYFFYLAPTVLFVILVCRFGVGGEHGNSLMAAAFVGGTMAAFAMWYAALILIAVGGAIADFFGSSYDNATIEFLQLASFAILLSFIVAHLAWKEGYAAGRASKDER